jgi:hypothetical protein
MGKELNEAELKEAKILRAEARDVVINWIEKFSK